MNLSSSYISIIIPVFNEAEGIHEFLIELKKRIGNDLFVEIIPVDGGSTDSTLEKIQALGISPLRSLKKGRASQMNAGATYAKGDILYFLHADTVPPKHFLSLIRKEIQNGADSGCFRLSFDEDNVLMRGYAWFTRFDLLPFRFGDQSLFINKNVFEDSGGFLEDHIVMEDNEFIKRLRKQHTFKVLEPCVITSARKYRENGFIRLQCIFTLIFVFYYLGANQETLVELYQEFINNSKI